MDPFDRQIVQYARLWAPFGGPPQDEILPRFGLTVPQFTSRLGELISALQAAESTLAAEDRELLVAAQHAVARR